MKKLLLISFLIAPIFAFGQKQVILKNGQVINHPVNSFIGKRLIFANKIPAIDRDFIEISEVAQLNGEIPEYRKNAILKKNPWIVFNQESVEQIAVESVKPLTMNKEITNLQYSKRKMPGDMLKQAGTLYIVGVSASIVGSGLSLADALDNKNDNNTLAIAGGIIGFAGFVCTIVGHVKLIEAGNALNHANLTFGMNSSGVGFAVNF